MGVEELFGLTAPPPKRVHFGIDPDNDSITLLITKDRVRVLVVPDLADPTVSDITIEYSRQFREDLNHPLLDGEVWHIIQNLAPYVNQITIARIRDE